MKKILFLPALIFIVISCNAQKPKRFSQPLDVQGTIINDTVIKFQNGGFIRKTAGGSTLEISPNGGEETVKIAIVPDPVGLTLTGIETLRFGSGLLYNDFTGLVNDTNTASFPDSTSSWSIKAIKDYVAEHGGGALLVGNGLYIENDTIKLGGGTKIKDNTVIGVQHNSVDYYDNEYQKGIYIYVSKNPKGSAQSVSSLQVKADYNPTLSPYERLDSSTYIKFTGFHCPTGSAGLYAESRFNELGFSYKDTLAGRNKNNPRWIPDKAYVDGLCSMGSNNSQTCQITCTYESSSTTPDSTGYILSIGSNLAGYNLVDMEAFYSNSQGTAVPTIHAWRDRSGTRVAMTSTGANFTTDATIDTSNDDVAKGDRVQIRWTLGSGTPPDGFSVQLTFQKP